MFNHLFKKVEKAHMERHLKLSSDEQRIVWAEVYIPNVPDTDGDYMDAEGIRDMSYKFMKNLRLKMIDTQHNNEVVNEACVVESFIARKGDPDFVEGAWVVGTHIPDADTWGRIKNGELNGYSMEAIVSKTPTKITLEIPEVVSGMCQKVEDGHDHAFYVTYDNEGNFLGGKTSISSGHYHNIKRASVTEEANGHAHRFAYLDEISTVRSVEAE